MTANWLRIGLIILSLCNIFWNISLYINPDKLTVFNYLFNLVYSTLFFYGGFTALLIKNKLKLKTTAGQTLFYFFVALTSYGLGQLVWTYYNLILASPIPYPSLSDLFFIVFQVFSILAQVAFIQSLGEKLSLYYLLELVIVSATIFLILYSFLSQANQGSAPLLARILNLLYPLLDSVMAALAIINLRTQKGRLYPSLFIFAIAAISMTIGDTLFSYRAAMNTYWNGGPSDTAYLAAGIFFAIGVIRIFIKPPQDSTLSDQL